MKLTQRAAVLALCGLFTAALPLALWWGESLEHVLGSVRLARKLNDSVPRELDGWKGEDSPLTEHELQTILCDDYVQRTYRGPAGEVVSLFVSFYGNKERGLQRYFHNPTVCYPAAGWRLAATRFESVTLTDAGKELPTCRYTFEQGGRRQVVLTLFKIDHEFLDESPRNKPFWMLTDRLSVDMDDSPGTFVQVNVVVPIQKNDEGAANALATRFLRTFGRPILNAVETGTGT